MICFLLYLVGVNINCGTATKTVRSRKKTYCSVLLVSGDKYVVCLTMQKSFQRFRFARLRTDKMESSFSVTTLKAKVHRVTTTCHACLCAAAVRGQ